MALRYGGQHQKKRALERPHQYGRPCCRCGEPLDGPIELDHRDDDPSRYLGWSHRRCNRAARNRLEAERAGPRYQPTAAAAAMHDCRASGCHTDPFRCACEGHSRGW